jgi:hypothetical protein
MHTITIDCDTCCMRRTAACTDCVVTYLCEREPGSSLVLDGTELRALRLLSGAGLVPRLRHAEPGPRR